MFYYLRERNCKKKKLQEKRKCKMHSCNLLVIGKFYVRSQLKLKSEHKRSEKEYCRNIINPENYSDFQDQI